MASRLWSGGFRVARVLTRRPVVQALRNASQQSTSDSSPRWLMVAAVGACGLAAYSVSSDMI